MSDRAWDNLNETLAPLQREYHAQIRLIAHDCCTRAVLDNPTPAEECAFRWRIEENVFESVDSHEWVIYTYKARLVALISDAEPDESTYIESPHPDEARAAVSMAEDIQNYLARCERECPTCDGEGDDCTRCAGTGRVFEFMPASHDASDIEWVPAPAL